MIWCLIYICRYCFNLNLTGQCTYSTSSFTLKSNPFLAVVENALTSLILKLVWNANFRSQLHPFYDHRQLIDEALLIFYFIHWTRLTGFLWFCMSNRLKNQWHNKVECVTTWDNQRNVVSSTSSRTKLVWHLPSRRWWMQNYDRSCIQSSWPFPAYLWSTSSK
jgi:hypothetical protein